jgi:hypothetical protein
MHYAILGQSLQGDANIGQRVRRADLLIRAIAPPLPKLSAATSRGAEVTVTCSVGAEEFAAFRVRNGDHTRVVGMRPTLAGRPWHPQRYFRFGW